jgi:hypothetical protein
MELLFGLEKKFQVLEHGAPSDFFGERDLQWLQNDNKEKC